ncbi:MAG: hypothetical protein K2M16_10140 [Muribaculaceae bacterium]|nr:hypothetical protein [Muribaculaceae bacterium]
MKKLMLLVFLLLINTVSMASSPRLASEKIFEDLDLYDSSLSITMIERNDQITRSVTFKNKPDLLKKIQKAIASDKENAVSKSLVTDNGEISESIVIINDEEEIKIGLNTSRSREVYFFVRIDSRKKHNDSNKSSRKTRSTKAKKTSKTEKTSWQNSNIVIEFDDNTCLVSRL